MSTLALVTPGLAHSGAQSGGAGYAPPEVKALSCEIEGDDGSCPQGTEVRVKGENLEPTTGVIFLGRRGAKDDRIARPVKATEHKVVVQVPTTATSGRIRVEGTDGSADGPRVKVARSAKPTGTSESSAADDGVFPIRGKHDYGTEVNRFGGGRGHQGQDVFAKCGRPIVSALSGTVTITKFQDRAGNYVVIKADDGTSQAYMHMLKPAVVSKGDTVLAGQRLGQVGETGRATGCHLHFELWTAPGWYEGGEAIDPLPALKAWDAGS